MSAAASQPSPAPPASERVARAVFATLPFVPAAMLAIGAWRQRWMDDDGFINLRVVRNLLHGHGLVFNLGERVEVCTSPLWLALVTLLGAARVPLEAAAVYLGIVLTVAAMVFAVRAADAFQWASRENTDSVAWPLGAGIFAVIPSAWDYASSGLETGLGLAWLGGSYAVLARCLRARPVGARSPRMIAVAILFGLGPLIRPEMALYSTAFFLPLVVRIVRAREEAAPRVLVSLLLLVASALALPLAFEIFRMGYFGTVTPNTAIAKEAFRINWSQGGCYFHNFFGVYAMGWPAAAVVVFFAARLRVLAANRDGVGAVAATAPFVAGLGHVLYIVAMGGDYMHGRMFLPPVFAILLPVAVVRIGDEPIWRQVVLGAAAVACSFWMGVCCLKLRVPTENECMIGDERRWYVTEADVATPIELARYAKHKFYKSGKTELEKIEKQCGAVVDERPHAGERCRTLYLDDDTMDKDKAQVTPQRESYKLAADIAPEIDVAVANGAIGIFGYLMPDTVHVIDRHGLAEPLASHLKLVGSRGRPGHEKKLTDSWLVARYAAPLVPDDARVIAARHALKCGALHDLVLAATAPLTWDRFVENVRKSFASSRLRIPPDPFQAEVQFCGTRPLFTRVAGGEGGDPFRWQCPWGTSLVAVRGAFSDSDKALTRVQPVCGTGEAAGGESDASSVGPPFGNTEEKEHGPTPFEVACPPGSIAVGLFGAKGKLIEGAGLTCASVGGGDPSGEGAAPASSSSTKTAAAGETGDQAFDLRCPTGHRVIGIVGRAGALVDQVGIVCSP